ncbi:alpha/beta hydrolase-fold protein [Undibacterium sp. TS12]|uniref:alpha/beta hydrolase n=1 Tax=Undibacterium sp. TS12 TaxID=2908202 RepID=UPI001F4CE2AC|nr:alpha/beta hydrolase-fold protein [Undibacterium sp. TS12]MCH8619833.1 alpha/beta hydrolase-fold protein [Undibacterium sp. TS12]
MKKFVIALLISCTCVVSVAAETPSVPLIWGHSQQIHSVSLGEDRIINVVVPEGYNEDTTSKYPVIYLLDGAMDEDFVHMAGAVQFSSFSWVNRLPPSILVGIANTDRKRDMTYKASANFRLPEWLATQRDSYKNAGGSARFMEFIEKELQPFVAKNYRVSGDRTLIGQSLAGLLATEVLLKKPQLFNNYIIMSPSLWWDNESLLRQAQPLLKIRPAQSMKVYLAVGEEGAEMVSNTRALAAALRQASKQGKNLTFHFEYLPQEDHGSILHGAVMKAFRLFHEQKK